jgi:hypothetical protein
VPARGPNRTTADELGLTSALIKLASTESASPPTNPDAMHFATFMRTLAMWRAH